MMFRLLLLVAAIVFAIIFTLFGFNWISTDHPWGWLGLSIACFAAAFLPFPDRPVA